MEPTATVVDFGCGPGFYLIPAARVVGKAIGVDVSPQMLERADKYAKKNKVKAELLESDGTSLRLPDSSVDLIMLVHVFHEVEEKPKVLKEFYRVLKPTGRLAIVEKSRSSGLLPKKFGPPIVDIAKLSEQLSEGGFALGETIPFGNSSIIIAAK